jgi:hypothetical protein
MEVPFRAQIGQEQSLNLLLLQLLVDYFIQQSQFQLSSCMILDQILVFLECQEFAFLLQKLQCYWSEYQDALYS